jgi:glutamate synthase (NADPH/NADH) small chain
LDVDLVIVSIGVSPNPLIPMSLPELETTKWKTITVDTETMQSNIPGLFAGGDIVRGGATVILAMGDGRKAAQNIHNYLQNNGKSKTTASKQDNKQN